MTKVTKLPFVEAHEEETARKLVDEQFTRLTGKPFQYRTAGYFITAKIYVRPEELKKITNNEGKEVTIWLPPSIQAEDKYQSVAALVCGVGPQAYKGENRDGSTRFPEGPWCRVGDWVTIPRYESFMFTYRGVAMVQFPDDKVLGVVEDPRDVAPINQADKV